MIVLGDVAVTVKNARSSAEWWERKLGFGVHTIGPPEGHAVMVAPPGDRFVLHLCEGFAPVEAGNTGISFVTDDIERKVREMEREGVVFTEPLKVASWGGSAKFADPDGNVFWLLGAPARFVRAEASRRAKVPRSGRVNRRASAPGGKPRKR
jgi:predicted enzyme related to lactoylglutathione lyase